MGRFDQKFEWAVENVSDFQERLKRLGEVSSDFRIPFRLIASDFYRSQKQIFTLKSRGMYEDLSKKYKPVKEKKLGFIYPILIGQTLNLSQSTLSNNHPNSVFDLNKANLTIGSDIPYGKYHQSDKKRTTLPQRKFIFIDGGKGDKSRGSGINGRRERWLMIIDTHIKQLITGEL